MHLKDNNISRLEELTEEEASAINGGAVIPIIPPFLSNQFTNNYIAEYLANVGTLPAINQVLGNNKSARAGYASIIRGISNVLPGGHL